MKKQKRIGMVGITILASLALWIFVENVAAGFRMGVAGAAKVRLPKNSQVQSPANADNGDPLEEINGEQDQNENLPTNGTVVSGNVTITKGYDFQQQSLVFSNGKGKTLFDPVPVGNWNIYAGLFDAAGHLIYVGSVGVAVKPEQDIEVGIPLSPNSLNRVTYTPSLGKAPSLGSSHMAGSAASSSAYGRILVSVNIPQGENPLPQGLIFWNDLGSANAILHSRVGPGGVQTGGRFTDDGGLFNRNAYEASPSDKFQLKFPLRDIWPSERGCIEFWARLRNYPSAPRDSGAPAFLQFDGPYPTNLADTFSVWEVGLNANDGNGGGGFFARPARVQSLATHIYSQTVGYASLLGGDPSGWHHYAVVWDKNGLPFSTNQVIDPYAGYDTSKGYGTCETFIDGVQNGGWYKGPKPEYDLGYSVKPVGEYLQVINNFYSVGDTQISNIKLWDYAKVDFSDRFNQ